MKKIPLLIVLSAILTFSLLAQTTADKNAKTGKKARNESGPQTAREYALLGFSFIQSQKWPEADHYLSEAISRDSANIFYYDLRASVRCNGKNYSGALADYSKALKLDSGDHSAYSGRAQIYYLLEEYEKALADLNSAIGLDADNSADYELRSKIELRQGKCVAAQADMIKAESLAK
jgi:tetratricopeptide (TPR) repeat protein